MDGSQNGCHFSNLQVVFFHLRSKLSIAIFRQSFVYILYRKEGKLSPQWQVRPKIKKTLVSRNPGDEKNLHLSGRKFIFLKQFH